MRKIKHSWCIDNNGYPVADDEVRRLISVRPSEIQLEWSEMRYYNFIHFGVNTFTNREWGDGTEDPAIFNPSALDTDQWCRVLKKSDSKGIIFTAKHHDGFCLYDSKYTDHTVMHSPYGKDILRQLQKSCEKYSLKLGIYLSPWDRHEKSYGTQAYNDFFVNQLTEICLNYGELFCFWFDGACGEGKDGRKQTYDWDRYYSVIRKLQPKALIANCGPDVRWIGNEGGRVRESEWSVIPWTEKTLDEIAESSQKEETLGLTCFDRKDSDLGSRKKLKNKAQLRWCPAEADVSITHGWFWHDDKYYKRAKNGGMRTAEELAEIYFNTAGGNAALLLNVPPDTRGLISEREIRNLDGFAEIVNSAMSTKVPFELMIVDKDSNEFMTSADCFALQDGETHALIKPSGKFRTMVIEEDIRYSQRVEKFEIYADGIRKFKGTTIGSCKIIRFPKGLDADDVLFVITQSRANPIIRSIKLYK